MDCHSKAFKVLLYDICGLWQRSKNLNQYNMKKLFGTSQLHSLCFFLMSQVKQLNIKTSLFSQCLLWPVAKAEIKDLNVACVASVSRLIPPHKGVKFFWRRILIFTWNYDHLWQPTFLTYGYVWSCRWELFGMTNIWNSIVLLLEKVF